MPAILNSAMLDWDTAIFDSETLLSSLRFTQNTLIPFWLWLKLIQSDSNSFNLTELDDGSHLESCHFGFRHFAQNNLHLFILTQLDDGSHVVFCHVVFGHLCFSCQTHSHLLRLVPPLAQKKLHSHFTAHHLHKKLHSFILTQLDDGSYLEICHLWFSHFAQKKNFTHSFWLNLMMAAILNSAMLDSDTLLSSLRFTQTLLFHSDSDSN